MHFSWEIRDADSRRQQFFRPFLLEGLGGVSGVGKASSMVSA